MVVGAQEEMMDEALTRWLAGFTAAVEDLTSSRPDVRRAAGAPPPPKAGIEWWRQRVGETAAELWIGADFAAQQAIGHMALAGSGIDNPDATTVEEAYAKLMVASARKADPRSEARLALAPDAEARFETIQVATAAGREPVLLWAAVRSALGARQGNTLDLLLDMALPVIIRFGSTRMPLSEVSRLGAGSVIDLNRPMDAPVEIVVNGRVVARGELVVVQGKYGVCVNEIASRREQL